MNYWLTLLSVVTGTLLYHAGKALWRRQWRRWKCPYPQTHTYDWCGRRQCRKD